MTTTHTDAQIIAASLDEPETFAELVRRHHAPIHRYIARRVGVDLADDLAADTFATAFAVRRRYASGRESARPWLFGIATNMLRRHRRHEARMLDAYSRTGRPAHVEPQPDDERGSALAAALGAMRPQHRDVLLLAALADLTYDEIAVALDVPVGTVRGWLNRARATATKELARRGVTPTPPVVPTTEAMDA